MRVQKLTSWTFMPICQSLQKTSIWERPEDLHNRADVDKMVKGPPDVLDKKEVETGSSEDELSHEKVKWV